MIAITCLLSRSAASNALVTNAIRATENGKSWTKTTSSFENIANYVIIKGRLKLLAILAFVCVIIPDHNEKV